MDRAQPVLLRRPQIGPHPRKPSVRSTVIRDLYFVGKLKQREIGRMFGLRQNSVSRIVSGQVRS